MLTTQNTALVIVDVQGKLSTLMVDREKFINNLTMMTQAALLMKIPILWNEQLPDKLGPTVSELRTLLKGMTPMVKSSFSCCGNTEFNAKLLEIKPKNILLMGMESHVCVYQTALDLLKSGFTVYLLADAVSSRTRENRDIGISAMQNAGAKISGVEMALFEMLKLAEGALFKEIISIVK